MCCVYFSDIKLVCTFLESSVTMKELDVLMAKLEQDNKILAELDRKRATICEYFICFYDNVTNKFNSF